jgi:hypothetical protein
MSFIRNPIVVTIISIASGAVATACYASSMHTPPVACSYIIPGVDVTGLSDGDIVDDVPFQLWFDTLIQPVDYNGNGFWYDGLGSAVGWSQQEDSEICVIDISSAS